MSAATTNVVRDYEAWISIGDILFDQTNRTVVEDQLLEILDGYVLNWKDKSSNIGIDLTYKQEQICQALIRWSEARKIA
jgi:hypothetical protein